MQKQEWRQDTYSAAGSDCQTARESLVAHHESNVVDQLLRFAGGS